MLCNYLIMFFRAAGCLGSAHAVQLIMIFCTAGCLPASCVVYRELFDENPDMLNPSMATELGIYAEGCGLAQCAMSWGHDEYFYRVLRHNGHNLPEEALFIIR